MEDDDESRGGDDKFYNVDRDDSFNDGESHVDKLITPVQSQSSQMTVPSLDNHLSTVVSTSSISVESDDCSQPCYHLSIVDYISSVSVESDDCSQYCYHLSTVDYNSSVFFESDDFFKPC